MRAFVTAAFVWLLAIPAFADARITVLVDVLKLSEAAQILKEEGLDYGSSLDDEMLGGQGGAGYQLQLQAIYDAPRMVETVRRALEDELQGEMLEQAITFYGSELGQKIVSLENSARRAIGDDDIEQAARGRYAELSGGDDPRLAQLTALVEAGDLVTNNVSSAMNSNYQFMRGLAEGGVLEMSDAEILRDVAQDMDEISEDTTGWMYGYFLMAYHPLTDDELDLYIAFARTPAGAALNRALFVGFGKAYEDISFGLGRAIALNTGAQDL